MKKAWLVCWNEYRRHVFRRRFILIILSLPFFIVLMGAVGALAVASEFDGRPVGYVDESGWLSAPVMPPADNSPFSDVKISRYTNETVAIGDLREGQLQGVFILPKDYTTSNDVRLVAMRPMSNQAVDGFRDFLRANLLREQPPQISNRMLTGMEFDFNTVDSSRQTNSQDWLNLVVPMLAGLLFVVVMNTSGGYLLQAVVEEKENRTMEIIVTSLSANKLMAGKIIGSLSVGLTQLLVWLAFPIAAYFILRSRIPLLQTLNLRLDFVALSIFALLAGFVMVAGLMAGIGATATESREAQQIAGLFTLPITIPYWFIGPIMSNPNSPLVRGLSYFPLTAPVTLPLRAAFTHLPAWEIALNLGLLYVSAFAAVWLAGRAFRMGMLRYGKALSWKEIFGRVRQ